MGGILMGDIRAWFSVCLVFFYFCDLNLERWPAEIKP